MWTLLVGGMAFFGTVFVFGWIWTYFRQTATGADPNTRKARASDGGVAAMEGALGGLGVVADVLAWIVNRLHGVLFCIIALGSLILMSLEGFDLTWFLVSLVILAYGIYRLVD